MSDEERFEKDGFLTTSLALEANLQVADTERSGKTMSGLHTEVSMKLNAINEAVEKFNVEVWLLWLYSRQANEKDHRYLEANAANVEMLVGSMAGRCMITLRWRDRDAETEEAHHYISLIGAEKLTLMELKKGYPKHVHGLCGFQGIGMNADSAVELILEAVRVSKELANDIRKAPESVTFG